jgi:ABC-type phosphate/phosphonate transport system substrate-binding protein/rhodanese-related sulfurtransferase
MFPLRCFIVALALQGLAFAAHAALHLSVSFDGSEDIANTPIFTNYVPMSTYLTKAVGEEVRLVPNMDTTLEMQHTRTGEYPLLLGPAQVIGSAVRNGYEAVAQFPDSERAVLVSLRSTGIKTLADAKGKRLALPAQDSLATYLILGELKDKGVDAAKYFSEVRNVRYHEATLYALTMGICDVAAASERVAKKWLAANPGLVIYQTSAVPSYGVAVRANVAQPVKDRIRLAFLQPQKSGGDLGALLGVPALRAGTKEDYHYVAHLGYFTPETLSGATVVSAEQVRELMAKGAPLFDVRDAKEYTEAHFRAARSVPYGEKSKKEANFDAALDTFRLSGLPEDKQASLILACNGGECWKSYKASVAAIRAGYQKVYWFRGGFPEWKSKGYLLDSGQAQVAQAK